MDIEVNAGGDAGTQGRDSPVTRYGGQKIRFDLVFRTRFQIGVHKFSKFPNPRRIDRNGTVYLKEIQVQILFVLARDFGARNTPTRGP